MSDPATVNYQPLLNMDGAVLKTLKASFKARSGVISVIILILGVGLLFAGGVGLWVLIGYAFYIGFRTKAYKNNLWEQFAAANDWPLDTTTSVYTLIPPSLQFGHSPNFSPIIQAQLGQLNSDLFTYQCTVGEGKYQQRFSFTVARVVTVKALPHIVLRSKKSRAHLQQDLADHEQLQLEGDFNNYFKLEIEKGQEVDALAVLTPDVMQTLVSYEQAEDVEIWGANLYFIMSSDRRDYKGMQQLIRSVTELGQQIAKNISLSTYMPPPVATNPTPAAVPNVPTAPVPVVPLNPQVQ